MVVFCNFIEDILLELLFNVLNYSDGNMNNSHEVI